MTIEEMTTTLRLSLARSQVPEQNHSALINYVTLGIPAGSFLEAVLRNDLREACACADIDNQLRLWWTVEWIYSHVPSIAWGSLDNYVAWIQKHAEAREPAAT